MVWPWAKEQQPAADHEQATTAHTQPEARAQARAEKAVSAQRWLAHYNSHFDDENPDE